MKKLLALMLALVMVFALAACGDSDSTSDTAESAAPSDNGNAESDMAYVQDKRLDLDHLQQRLGDVTGAVLGRHRQKFAALAASLDAMSPLAVLGRGYAVARDEQGKILKSWRETAPGSRVSVTLGEGGFTAVVDKPYTKEEQP